MERTCEPAEKSGTERIFLSELEWLRIHTALRLSVRESEIARGVLVGGSEQEIAASLSISAHTVHSYLDRIYRKVGARSRCGLVTRLFATFVQIHRLNGTATASTEMVPQPSERVPSRAPRRA